MCMWKTRKLKSENAHPFFDEASLKTSFCVSQAPKPASFQNFTKNDTVCSYVLRSVQVNVAKERIRENL